MTLNGLLIDGVLRVTGDLRRLRLRHCTLAPRAAGLLVDAANVEALQFDLPRKALRNGTYFIQLQFDQGAVTRKLVFN